MAIGISAVVAGLPLSPIAGARGALYGIATSINDFIDEHIEKLKQSANDTIACTGRVLEAAKYGFGIGYLSSVTVLAVGQLLLGNTLAAMGVIATAATLTNPIAMTCAALGAIVYGWYALSEEERANILDRLVEGLGIGAELVRSLIDFVIRKTKEGLRKNQLPALKEFVKVQAAQFGRSLYDVTGKASDLVKGAAEMAAELAGQAAGATTSVMKDVYDVAANSASSVEEATKQAAKRTAIATSQTADAVVSAAKQALGMKSDLPPELTAQPKVGNDKSGS